MDQEPQKTRAQQHDNHSSMGAAGAKAMLRAKMEEAEAALSQFGPAAAVQFGFSVIVRSLGQRLSGCQTLKPEPVASWK